MLVSCMVGPSAMGSEKGTPSSMMSAPPFCMARHIGTVSAEVGYPAVTNVTRAHWLVVSVMYSEIIATRLFRFKDVLDRLHFRRVVSEFGCGLTMTLTRSSNEARVLVIYTGGTIGMLVGTQGYVPEPFFLTESLRRQKRFHDPLQDSLFSNSGSVHGYREWSSADKPTTPPPLSPHLTVKSCRPIAPQSEKLSENIYQASFPSLITPKTVAPGSSAARRIRFAILEVRVPSTTQPSYKQIHSGTHYLTAAT